MTPPGFGPIIPASERPQTRALDRAATGSYKTQEVNSVNDARKLQIIILCNYIEIVITNRSSGIKPSEKKREYRKWKNAVSSFNHLSTAEYSTEMGFVWLQLHHVFHTNSNENPTRTRISHRMSRWRHVYFNPLHVSSNCVLIFRRTIVLIQLLVYFSLLWDVTQHRLIVG